MTDSYRKRKFAGPTMQERRQIVPEPPKVRPLPKDRTYVLRTIVTLITVREETARYPTRAAREQAKRDRIKKNQQDNQRRCTYGLYKRHDTQVRFEEEEE